MEDRNRLNSQIGMAENREVAEDKLPGDIRGSIADDLSQQTEFVRGGFRHAQSLQRDFRREVAEIDEK